MREVVGGHAAVSPMKRKVQHFSILILDLCIDINVVSGTSEKRRLYDVGMLSVSEDKKSF